MSLRRIAFTLGAVALAALGIELVSLVTHELFMGGSFSYRAAQETRLAISGQPATEVAPDPQLPIRGPDEDEENAAQALHPYLGYVLDPARAGRWPVNDLGFIGDLPPMGPESGDAISIALVGGSVAENTGIFGARELRRELESIEAFAGRELRISLLALRGMKQPQQLMTIDWLLSLGARTRLQQALLARSDSSDYAARGPRRDYSDATERARDLVSYWKRSSVLLDQRAQASGFRYFHFLQSNQWVDGSKTFSKREQSIARPDHYVRREAAILGYRELIEAGHRLREGGVAFTDLTMIFRDVEAPLYIDPCCHVNREGYERIATAIGRTIREAYARDVAR
jgi:hypothetical protein